MAAAATSFRSASRDGTGGRTARARGRAPASPLRPSPPPPSPPPSSLFGGGFGGFGGFGGADEPQTPRGADVRVPLAVTLADAYLGATFSVARDKLVPKPAPGKRQCNCKARVRTRQIGPGMYQQYHEQECEECDNVRLVRDTVALSVTVDPGAPAGTEIRFFGEGEPEVDGDPGDLVFVVAPAAHPRFARAGDDLRLNVTIPLVDALVGFDTVFTHLDGRKVRLAAAGVTRPGAVVTLVGEGMPRAGAPHLKGDLEVTFAIEFPAKLTEKQKKAVREHFQVPARDEL